MLTPGTKLGPYEIVAPLGAGGMGEVYRARDTRLGRDVAIKVLPQHLSPHPEVRARFEREARTISSLNHPHICTLFDVGREGDTDYLVMELVEGETLAERLTKGPLSPEQVLKIGIEMADALDRAHRAGVIHRDLKPGNVMLTRSGTKLMDFGLARATGLVAEPGVSVAMTQSPTIGQPLTAEGTIIGTFQYMAPEQLGGKKADARSDLWALGCVLYEVTTGKRAFEGRSQASLISAIMSSEPAPLTQLAPLSPPALEYVVRACLAKDPDERIQTAHDVKLQLQWVAGDGSATALLQPVASRPRVRERLAWLVGAVGLAAIAAAALFLPRGVRPALPRSALTLTSPMPPGVTLNDQAGTFALSPDGGSLAVVAADSMGNEQLWIRPLDSRAARPLQATQGASLPFWSPDSRFVGFFAQGKLRKIAVAGGTPEDICEAAAGRGGTWNRAGVILYAPGAEGPIYRVSAQGGTTEPATAVDSTKHEGGHRFPRFLPDGRHFLYATTPAGDKGEHECYLGTLDSKERLFVLRADGVPEFGRPGWLIFHKNRLLFAQRFDPGSGTLSGQPQPLLASGMGSGFLAVSTAWISDSGLLACRPPDQDLGRLVSVDRSGRAEAIGSFPAAGWAEPRLSPDGLRAAVGRSSEQSNASSGVDIWLTDLVRGVATRLTFEPNIARLPVWSPDGRTILYASNKTGVYSLYLKSATGGTEPEFVARGSGLVILATDWSQDRRFVTYEVQDPRTSSDIWLLSMDGERKAVPLLHSPFSEQAARISPDGRWIAYRSDETSRSEIYIQSFPTLGNKMQISSAGGTSPEWRGDGRELFYRGLDGSVMAVKVEAGPAFHTDSPVRLFRLSSRDTGYSPAPDGQRFLFVLLEESADRLNPVIVVNWQGLLKEK